VGDDEAADSREPLANKKQKDAKSSEGKKQAAHFSSAATQASVTHSGNMLSKDEPGTRDKTEESKTKKKKEKREVNVGGWVSPLFSDCIDRAWLQKDTAHKHLDLRNYAPQAGDTVL